MTESSTNAPRLRVLAVAAHPDDVELFCAGTLARYARRGDHLSIALACRGDSASLDLSPEQLVEVRRQEATAAAGLIGADLIQLGWPDWGLDANSDNRRVFTDAIRQARPDVIFTHFHSDYGSDHNNTFALVRDAALMASVPGIESTHPALLRSPAIFMWEPLGGFGFQPELFVDVTETMHTKIAMLECHRSQRQWLHRHGGIDFAHYVDTMARFRGYQAGVQMAEGFVPLKNWASIRAHSLLP